MKKNKIFFLAILIVSAVGGVFAAHLSRTTCVLFSQNAEGACAVLWPESVTTLPEGNFITNTMVTTRMNAPCVMQNVFSCAGK